MKTQHEIDIDELVKWLRGIEFHDEDEDGIGEVALFFKIRDEEERMVRIFDELTKDEVISILARFVRDECGPCEGFDDDWRGNKLKMENGKWRMAEDGDFTVDWAWDDVWEGIRMWASFRT